jgi:hypothetical protein
VNRKIEVVRATNVDAGVEVDTLSDARGAEYRWAQRYRPQGENWTSWYCCSGEGHEAYRVTDEESNAINWIQDGVS